MKKLIVIPVLFLLFSCDLFINSTSQELSIVVSTGSQTRAITLADIASIRLKVVGPDMPLIDKVFTSTTVQVGVPVGPARTFTLEITMNDDTTYTGSKVVDVTEFTKSVTINVEEVFSGSIQIGEDLIGFGKQVRLRATDIPPGSPYTVDKSYMLVINKDKISLQTNSTGTSLLEDNLSCNYLGTTAGEGSYLTSSATLNISNGQTPWKVVFTFIDEAVSTAIPTKGTYICTSPDEATLYHEGTFVVRSGEPGAARIERTQELIYTKAAIKCTVTTVGTGNTSDIIGDIFTYSFKNFVTESAIIYVQKNSDPEAALTIFGPEVFSEPNERDYPKSIMVKLTNSLNVVTYLNLTFTGPDTGTYWLSGGKNETLLIHKGSFDLTIK